MGAGFFIASTLGSDSAYFGPVLASMVLMAVGLGLVTAPSTGAILAVLPLGKAGVGSAVNDVSRELGGTFEQAQTVRDLATPSAAWDCVDYWSIGTDSGGVQAWDGSWSNVTTTTSTAVAASVAGTCHSCSSHRRYGKHCACGCAVGNRDAADLSRWRTKLGRMRRAGQRHSPQAAGVHQDSGSLATHEGLSGDRRRQSGS